MKIRNTSNADAPCGATHYYANNRGVGFYKLRDEKWMFWSPDDSEWKPVVDNYPAFRAIEIQQEENQMNIDKVETQTPEEKEALDSIKPVHLRDYQKNTQTEHQEAMSAFSGEVDWNNGDAVSYNNKNYFYVGKYPIDNFYAVVIESDESDFQCVPRNQLSKPETQQQREDRERLEAAYDLYLAFWSASKSSIILESYNEFSSRGNSDLKHFLAVVDKTNYRKGVK